MGGGGMAERAGLNYRAYAIQQLAIAILKEDDAPASAQMHEEQAAYALRVGREPESGEVLRWIGQPGSIAEDWPCSFGHHTHATRDEAVACARTRR